MLNKNKISSRSTNIVNERNNRDFLNQIITTKQILNTINLISNSINNIEKNNSISLVGPYGSGKSTTALVAYYYLINKLPSKLSKFFDSKNVSKNNNQYNKNEIFLYEGERTSIKKMLSQDFGENTIEKIKSRLSKNKKTAIIIDEFGKLLEYSADYPEDGDVYILQQIAELSQKSNGNLLLITIRHQSISAYVSTLSGSYLKEWKKVQGRFYEIIHTNTIDETIKLFYLYAKNIFKSKAHRYSLIKKNLDLNPFLNKSIVKDLLSIDLIHPFTTLLAISIFKKIAQNERSIFSFLNSSEYFSINDLLKDKNVKSYKISNFFDYIDENLSHVILESEFSQNWQAAKSSINIIKNSNFQTLNENDYNLLIEIIKTISLINMFGENVGLQSTIEVLNLSLNDSDKIKKSKIEKLLNNKNINYKKYNKTYHLWHGTDLNINNLIEEKISEIKQNFDYAEAFEKYFYHEPVIARKLYIQKGTLRYALCKYINIEDIKNSILNENSDGTIYFVINSKFKSKSYFITKIKDEINSKSDVHKLPFIYILLSLNSKAKNLIEQYYSICYLLDHNKEISKDSIAKKELAELKSVYFNNLETLFKSNSDLISYDFINNKNSKNIRSSDLGTLLSDELDKVYNKTPKIFNEIINKNKPSPSANSGLKKFLFHLVRMKDQENIGITGNGPEKSIYLNLLKKTEIHIKKENKWAFEWPSKTLDNALNTIWEEINNRICQNINSDEKINIQDLESFLYKAPYGLKKGLAKTLVLTAIINKLEHISMYEEGSFTPKLEKDTIDRLTKRPDKFTIKYISHEGLHDTFFQKIHTTLLDTISEDRPLQGSLVSLLDVVTPLVKFANRLPKYTKKAKMLDSTSITIIKKILNVRDPEKLIYNDIPEALGMKKIDISKTIEKEYIDNYVNQLEICCNKISQYRVELTEFCINEFKGIWKLKSNKLSKCRAELKNLFNKETSNFFFDEKLKILRNKIYDDNLGDIPWIENIATYISDKSLDNWYDNTDKNLFSRELSYYYIKFSEAVKNKLLNYDKDIDVSDLETEIIFSGKKLNLEGEDLIIALTKIRENLMNKLKKDE